MRTIAFATHLPELMNHFRSIIRALPEPPDIINCAPARSAAYERIDELAQAEGCRCLAADALEGTPAYDVLVTPQMHVAPWDGDRPGITRWARRHVRLSYALGKTDWNLDAWNRFYDLILCFGPYQQRLFEHRFPGLATQAVGYPRFDAFFAEPFDRDRFVTDLGGVPDRRNVVWLPTYSVLSSINQFADAVANLTGRYNTFVKVHPGTPLFEPEVFARLKALNFTALIADDFDNVPLFRIADWVLADYGGSAFGALYTDRNLLLLDSPGDLFAADTGWLSADIQLRGDFPSVAPDDAQRLSVLLEDAAVWDQQVDVRARYRQALFRAPAADCGATAAAAIVQQAHIDAPHRPHSLEPRPVPDQLLRIVEQPSLPVHGMPRPVYGWVRARLAELDADLQSARRRGDDALLQLGALQIEAQARSGQHASANERIEAQAVELNGLRTELGTQQQIASEFKERLGRAEQDADAAQAHMATELRSLAEQAQQDAARQTRAAIDAQRQLETARAESALHQQELHRLHAESEHLQREHLVLRRELHRLTGALDSARVESEQQARGINLHAARHALERQQLETALASLQAHRDRDRHLGARIEVRLGDALRGSVPVEEPDLEAPAAPLVELDAVDGAGRRVLMICDDVQIDRRILQEAISLRGQGFDVVVLGRAASGYETVEIQHGIKIERVDHEAFVAARAQRSSAVAALVDRGAEAVPAALSIDVEGAAQLLSNSLQIDAGLPRYPSFVERQPRLARVLLRALFWPPYRLDLLRRYLPAHYVVHYALYLPSLLLTPWPAALAWHWRRLRRRLTSRNRRGDQELPIDLGSSAAASIEREIVRFADLNVWELALYERGVLLEPDIVHVHDLPQLRPGCFIAAQRNVPVVYDAHELYPLIHTLSPDQQERLTVVENHFVKRVDAMITVNPLIAQRQARDYNIQAPRVVLNAAQLWEDRSRPDVIRSTLGIDAPARTVLFQGWISFDRGIGHLVEAMAQVAADIHLVLLGYGDDLPALERLAAERGVGARVHFAAPVPQDELMWWVQSADAGVIPYQPIDENHRLCSPNKLFEFIAAGVPIIANDLPYLRAVVGDHGFGVVTPLDSASDYAAAINRMFDVSLGGPQRFRDALQVRREPFLWPAQERVLFGVYAGLPVRRRGPAEPVAAGHAAQLPERPVSVALARPPANGPGKLAPLRVFHGLYNVAGIPSIMARAERAIGLDSRSICLPSGHFAYQPDIEELPAISGSDIIGRFKRYADQFDVFVFHFGHSLANDSLADIALLKRMGKGIIFYFHGCDVRGSKDTIRKYKYSACQVCWPQKCNANRDLARDTALRYADAIWVSTPDLLEFLPGAELFLQPIDVAAHAFALPSAPAIGAPRTVVHAPSDARLKGTEHLVAAVESMRGRPSVDLHLLQGLSHDEVMRRIRAADFGVDQLLIGSYGMFSVELMAAGIPVICYLREDLVAKYPEPPPLIRADPGDIELVLRETVLREGSWDDLSIAGRRYVERHHAAEVAAQRAAVTYARICARDSHVRARTVTR